MLKIYLLTILSLMCAGCSMDALVQRASELKGIDPNTQNPSTNPGADPSDKISSIIINGYKEVTTNYLAEGLNFDSDGNAIFIAGQASRYIAKKVNPLGEYLPLIGDSFQFERKKHSYLKSAFDSANNRIIYILSPSTGSPIIEVVGEEGADPNFNNGQELTFSQMSFQNFSWMGVDNLGRIYMGGKYTSGSVSGIDIFRLLPDGSMDLGYGINGRNRIYESGTGTYFRECQIQIDQKLVCVVYDGSELRVLRTNVDGTLDASFGTNGIFVDTALSFGINESAYYSMAIHSSGKIYLYVTNSSTRFIYSLNADGTKNTDFGTNGIFDLAGLIEKRGSIVVLPSGDVVVAGLYLNGSNSTLRVVNLGITGELQSDFGTSGVVDFVAVYGATNPLWSIIAGIGATDDGGMMIFGNRFVNTSTRQNYALKINNDGTTDGNFAPNGIRPISFDITSHETVLDSVHDNGDTYVLSKQDNSPTVYLNRIREGELDVSFGTQGLFGTQGAPSGYALEGRLTVANDRSLVVSVLGQNTSTEVISNRVFLVSRTGALQSSFIVITTPSNVPQSQAVVVQNAQGDFYIFYQLLSGVDALKGAIVKTNSTLARVTSFGSSGTLVMSDKFEPLAGVFKDERIYVVGNTYRNNGSADIVELTVKRYLADGSLDSAYNGTGYLSREISDPADSAMIRFKDDDLIVVANSEAADKSYVFKSDVPTIKEILNSVSDLVNHSIKGSDDNYVLAGKNNNNRASFSLMDEQGTLRSSYEFETENLRDTHQFQRIIMTDTGYVASGVIERPDGTRDILILSYDVK